MVTLAGQQVVVSPFPVDRGLGPIGRPRRRRDFEACVATGDDVRGLLGGAVWYWVLAMTALGGVRLLVRHAAALTWEGG